MKGFFVLIVLLPFLASSQLKPANIFSDHMVLQREVPIHIWGKATPGKNVIVSFASQTRHTVAQKNSSWSVSFTRQKANSNPQTIFITCGNESAEFHNVLIGDIWLCSGQSNMEFPMLREVHWQQEKNNAYQPLIRLNNPSPAGRSVYGVAYTDSLNKRLNTNDFYQSTSWQICDSNTVKGMSAVAYFFAKAIIEQKNIPIGLINLSIGGAPIETFISREALQRYKRFASKVTGNWLDNKSLPKWVRQRGKENVGKNVNGFNDDLGLNHAYKPGFAFQSGIKPLLPLAVKGVIWYQGESNSLEKERVEEYKDLLHLLIDDYRKSWKQFKMPFYWVQLSSIDTIKYQSQYWPQFRDEQRKLLNEIKNGGMAVCSDIGCKNDVHPTNKKEVGKRLARWALNNSYKVAMVPSGPLPLDAIYTKGKVIVSFKYANGLQTAEGKAIRGFSVDGNRDIETVVHSQNVIIPVAQKPEFVFYGWKPFSDANLVNAERLPASTFKIKVR